MSQLQRRSNGRPTKTQQLEIQKELREYYERGTSAVFTSNKSGINIKTVCIYFNNWTNELKQIEEKDFFIRQRREKERSILNLEYMIDKLYIFLKQIDDEITTCKKEKTPIPKHLFSLKLQILSTIGNFTQQKGVLGMTPTTDFDLAESLSKLRQKKPKENPNEPVKYY